MTELSKDRVRELLTLVQQIFEQGRAFKVFPPKEVVDDPAVLRDPAVVEKLAGTQWWLKFHNGDETLLEFVELLALVYQLREFRRRLGASTGTVTVSVQFSVKDVLEQATELLASLDLEGIAREPFVPTYPLFGLHDADGRLVCTQAGTDRIAFVFTSEALAAAFATALRHGRAVRIADDAAAFKVLLKLGASNAVAFDPLFASGRVEVTTLVPVATILAR